MGTPSILIFQGLGPEAAAARLSQATVAEAVPSLAALQAGMHLLPEQSETMAELDPLIDQYLDAVRYHRNTTRLRLLIEGKIMRMRPEDWFRSTARFAVSWRRRAAPDKSEATPSRAKPGKPPQPSSSFQQAVVKEIRRASHYDPELEALKGRAGALRAAGRGEEAAALYEHIAKQYVRQMDFLTAAYFYYCAGGLYLNSKHYAQALASAARAKYYILRATEKDPRRLEQAENLWQQARDEALGRISATKESAVARAVRGIFQEVATIHQREGEKRLEAEAYHLLSAYLIELKQYAQAYEMATLASDLFFNEGLFELAGEALARMAKSLFEAKGDGKMVPSLLEKAAAAFHRAGLTEREAEMYDLKGDALRSERKFLLAAAAYGRAARTYQQGGNQDKAYEARFNKNFALEKGGAEDQAFESWVDLVEEIQKSGPLSRLAQCYYYMANLLAKKGRHYSAVEFWRRAGQLFSQTEETHLAVAAFGLASLALTKLGQLREAKKSWRSAVQTIYAQGDQGGEAVARIIIGRALYDFERYAEAREIMERGLRGLRVMEHPRLGESYESLAKILGELKLWRQAEETLHLAYRTHVESKNREGAVRVRETRERLFSH